MPGLEEFVRHPNEERNLEFKGAVSWNNAEHKGKIVRAAMAMSNIQNGGVIVVGVDENARPPALLGLPDVEQARFSQDNVSVEVNRYASPPVELTVRHVEIDSSRFVVIQIREFAELPVVCRKAGPGGLREGAMYTRPKSKNESVEVGSETEMREILDLMLEKGLRRFRRLAVASGLTQAADDERAFEEERDGL